MKLLITSLPGYGHLCPFIPIARAVQAAGHEVAFATSQSVSGRIIPSDLTLLSCGPAWLETDFAHDTATRAHPSIAVPLYRYLSDTVVPHMICDIGKIIEDWCPDIILSNEYERAGCALAEKYHIPFVLVSAGPRVSRQLRRQWHAPLHAPSRKMLDLPADDELSYMFKWLHLYLTPHQYAYEGDYHAAQNEFAVRVESADLGIASSNIFSFSLYDPHIKHVLCTFGTVFNKNLELREAIIKAFDHTPHRLILTHCPNAANYQENHNVIQLPDYVPLSQIAPHVDAVITHGGTSTLLALLQYGKPMLLLPQGADQNVNAIACKRLGLALCDFNSVPQAIGVEARGIIIEPKAIEKMIGQLLSDITLQTHSQKIKEYFSFIPKLPTVALMLEELVTNRQPITRSN